MPDEHGHAECYALLGAYGLQTFDALNVALLLSRAAVHTPNEYVLFESQLQGILIFSACCLAVGIFLLGWGGVRSGEPKRKQGFRLTRTRQAWLRCV